MAMFDMSSVVMLMGYDGSWRIGVDGEHHPKWRPHDIADKHAEKPNFVNRLFIITRNFTDNSVVFYFVKVGMESNCYYIILSPTMETS